MNNQLLKKLTLTAVVPFLVVGSVFGYRMMLGHYWQIGSPAAYEVLLKSTAIVDIAQSIKQQTAINPFLLVMTIVLRLTHFLLSQGLHLSDPLMVYAMLRPEVYLTVMHASLLLGLALILWWGGWLLANRQAPWWQISLLQGSILFSSLGLHESLMPTTQLLAILVGYLFLIMIFPQLAVKSATDDQSEQLQFFLDHKSLFTWQWSPISIGMAGLMIVGLSLQSWWASLLWWPVAILKSNRARVQYLLTLVFIPELIGYLHHYYQAHSFLSNPPAMSWKVLFLDTRPIFLVSWSVLVLLLAATLTLSKKKSTNPLASQLLVGWVITLLWTTFLQMINPTQSFWLGPSLLLPTIAGWIIVNAGPTQSWLAKITVIFLLTQLGYVGINAVTQVWSSRNVVTQQVDSNTEIVDHSLSFTEVSQQIDQYSPRLRHLIYGLSFTSESVQSTFFALYGK